MATQTALTNQMRSSVDLPPPCPSAHRGSFSVPVESACLPVVCVMDGWTAVLLMGLMSKVIYRCSTLHVSKCITQGTLLSSVALVGSCLLCFHMRPNLDDYFSVQYVCDFNELYFCWSRLWCGVWPGRIPVCWRTLYSLLAPLWWTWWLWRPQWWERVGFQFCWDLVLRTQLSNAVRQQAMSKLSSSVSQWHFLNATYITHLNIFFLKSMKWFHITLIFF